MQAILVEYMLRTSLIAGAIALVLVAMRIKTASVRHAVWSSVIVVMLLFPAWIAWGPRAALPLLPPSTAQTELEIPAADFPRIAPVQHRSASLEPQPSTWNWEMVLIGSLYFLGASILLTRLAIGTLRTVRLTSASCVVPVTVGFFHPRIILPEGANGWSPAQLDTVLLHEREHARRRDPLFQWIALLNRALFWFHPLAWWLERQLSGLAEEACDAAVLSNGHDPHDYSETLLGLSRSVERAGRRVGILGMAMPGAALPQRIRRMLSGTPIPPRVSRSRLAFTAAACSAVVVLLAGSTLVSAQSRPSPSPGPSRQAEPTVLNPNNPAAPVFETAPPRQPSEPAQKSLTEELAGRLPQAPGSYIDDDQEQYRRRMEYSNDHFSEGRMPGWGSARGQVYVRYGSPDRIDDHSGAVTVPPYQIWHYAHIEGVGDNVMIEFVDPARTGQYREALSPWAGTLDVTPTAAGVTYRAYGSVGVTIEVRELGQTAVAIRIENGIGPFELHGAIASAGGRSVNAFDEKAAPLAPYSSRPVPLLPGSYKLELSVKDGATGVTTATEIPFQVP